MCVCMCVHDVILVKWGTNQAELHLGVLTFLPGNSQKLRQQFTKDAIQLATSGGGMQTDLLKCTSVKRGTVLIHRYVSVEEGEGFQ